MPCLPRWRDAVRVLACLLLPVLLLLPPRLAGAAGDPNCLFTCPAGGGDSPLLRRESHTLSNNGVTKFADWVAYQVAAANIGPSRRRVWRADPDIAAALTLEPADYRGAHKALGTDRGHQAPLASFSGLEGWRTTNYLSNITPQKSALNQGPWKHLESAVRRLARSGAGAVHVLTGPLYERGMPPLPGADEPHQVPSGYWKIVLLAPLPPPPPPPASSVSAPSPAAGASPSAGPLQVAGFIFDQETPRRAVFCAPAWRAPVAEIARRSGLVFAPALMDAAVSGAAGDLAVRLGCKAGQQGEAAPR